jgi:alpha-mannosidase
MILYHHQRRVDFHTTVRWNETNKLLKVAFPMDLVAAKATFEIPFGALERPMNRNTSWEQAQFEVCGHRFADVSEGNYGVSLMNDCKYGYDVKEGTLRLSLLRAPKWPDHSADQGEHEFTYSLYPHELDWRSAQVVRKAAELNHPVIVEASHVKKGPLPSVHSFIRLESRHVMLEAVKQAEDGTGTVLRLYESAGCRETVTIRLPRVPEQVWLTNLLEEEEQEIGLTDGAIELDFRPFEIKTLKWR